MLNSIVDDIKRSFTAGNMIIRLIIVNVAVYILLALLQAFTPSTSGFYHSFIQYIAVPGDLMTLLTRPWTLFTNMFVHSGFWHVASNMLYLYWFGRIAGDLIGDRHILPIYLLGGLAGATAYIASYQIMGAAVIGSYAMGSSAAVMALVIVSGLIAPEYNIRLILLGNVKLQYIVLAIILFDLIGVAGHNNTGGHIAHLGGMLMGYVYLSQLRDGKDGSKWFTSLIGKFKGLPTSKSKRGKSPLRVSYNADKKNPKKHSKSSITIQEEVDEILEKIKREGYDKLTEEEKEVLYKASKN